MVLGRGSIVLNFWHGFRSRIYMYSWLDGVKETNIYMDFFFNQEQFIIVCNHNKKLLSVKKSIYVCQFCPWSSPPTPGVLCRQLSVKKQFFYNWNVSRYYFSMVLYMHACCHWAQDWTFCDQAVARMIVKIVFLVYFFTLPFST